MIIRRSVQDRITEAVCFQHISPAFQPIVHLRSARTVGFEVLARWNDSELGPVSPEEFIPAAQARSLLAILTYNLIRSACTAASTWPHDFYLAFNVPPSLMQDVQAMTLLTDAVTEAGFAFNRVRIEMTEAELVEDEPAVRRAVQLLKQKGMKVILDDFGAGFSSLVRLNEIDFDEIKIDGGFIRKIDVDADSRRIISAIVGLGHSLEIPVVAESIETPEHADFLRRLGCEYGQGWLFGRPVAAEDAQLFLGNRGAMVRAETGIHLSPYHRQYQLETLYTASPVGLCFLDTTKRHVAANEAFCRMLDMAHEQVIGRTVREIFNDDVATMIEEIVDRKLQGEQGDPLEFQFPGAQEVYLIYHHRVVDDAGALLGLSVVSLDITARKVAERALHDSERQYRNSVEFSPTVMWIAESDGSLSYISPMADEPSGRSVEDRLNSWYSRMDSDDKVRVRNEWIDWLPTGLPFETRFRVEWPQGTWRWVRSRARPQTKGDVIERWFGAFSDITREVELEQRVAELEAALRIRGTGS